MGYDYIIIEKANGLSGSAVFYRKDKFRCLVKSHIDIDDQLGERPLVFCLLEEIKTGLRLVFAETHLKAMPGFRNQIKRNAEVEKIRKFFQTNFIDTLVFVCGDFNDMPGQSPITSMENDFIDLHTILS